MSAQKTVLLVEDNEKILEANRLALIGAGVQIDTAVNLAEARACIARREPDAIVLDILLPDGNGLDFLIEIRERILAPVILLTSLDEKMDMLAGLRAGGDDYITKPYDLDVLREKVVAALRRSEMYERHVRETLVRGPLTFDLIGQRALLHGEDMLLTQKEFSLLLMLVQNEGNILDAVTLYETVWNAPMGTDGNALWKHISRLKSKLAGKDEIIRITALRGSGYMLEIIKNK